MPVLARRIVKWTAISLGALIVLIGLLLAGFGLVMTRVPAYRAQVQEWISERARLDIEFAELGARWRWYGPELVFDQAVVRSADRQRVLAVAERGGVGFDLWTALRSGRLTAGRFSLRGTELKLVRTPEGKFALIGLEDLPDFNRIEPLRVDTLPIGRLEVREVRLSFQDLKTGRGPWLLSNIAIDVERDTQRIDVNGRALLPAALGSELRFAAHSDGSLTSVEALPWQADVSGVGLDLTGWADVMPDDWPAPQAGAGSFQVHGIFHGAALRELSGRLDFANVRVTPPQWFMPLPQPDVLQTRDESGAVIAPEESRPPTAAAAAPLEYTRASAAIRTRRTEQGWHTDIEQLQLSRPGAVWQPSRAEFSVERSAEGGMRVDAKADLLVLENLWPLLAYLPESEQNARWRALNASGRLTGLEVQLTRANTEAARFQLTATLSGLGLSAVGKTPGLSGLSGTLTTSETQGSLTLDSADVSVSLPRLFRTPLPVDRLAGTIDWRRLERGWEIRSTELNIDNADGHVRTRFTLQAPNEGSPVIDMHADASDLNALAAPRYMPAGTLSGKTLAWFDRAFTAGRVPRAELTLQGPLSSFPFRDRQGLFLIKAQIEGLTLDYQAGWMPATAINAEAEFRNAGLTATVSTADVNGLRITQGVVRFEDFKDAALELKANAAGELRQALDYLQQSPVGPMLGDAFQSLQGGGALDAQLSLTLPLKNSEKRKLDVIAALKDAQVGLRGLTSQAEAVNGGLRVTDKAIADINVSGRFLNGPFAVTAAAPADGRATPTFIASGRVAAPELASFLHLPGFVKLSGETAWRLSTAAVGARASEGKTLFAVDSDLQGLGIDLPEPVAKSADATRALHIEAERAAGEAMLVRGSLGSLRAVVRVQKQADGWSFDRAGLRADSMAASLPAHTGLRVEGAIDELVLDDWLKLNTGAKPGGSGKPLNEILRAANVSVGRFRLYGYEWPAVRGVLQATDNGWRVDVSGPEASGQVLIPYRFDAASPLTLNLDRLKLHRVARQAAAASKPLDPRDLPALSADIKEFEYGEHNFGAVSLQAAKTPQGLQVTALRASSEEFTGNGNGSWFVTPDGQMSTLNVTIESSNLRAAMQRLNYLDFIEGAHGMLYADLSWPGGLDGDWLGRSSGRIEIQAEDGQLLNVQPGAGRVLGLLSIAALPRRLSLDFRDLTDKGLRFDSIHGEFMVNNGDAYTENLLLRGPAAEIGIAGRIGFAQRDYDQTAVVTGNLGSSLPVAGTLAGGPVVGAALLLFTQLFKEPLKGVARGYYHITGSWDDPIVERIDADAAKEMENSAPLESNTPS